MRNYEVTFIVDPILSSDEIKAAAQKYVKYLENEGCKIVHIDEMGLLQLAYPIKKRTSGIYYCIEFEVPTGALIDNLELTFRRDEHIMRFLTVSLDKYGVKYNDDKRKGLIGKAKKKKANPEAMAATPAPAPHAKPVDVKKKETLAAPVVTDVLDEEE